MEKLANSFKNLANVRSKLKKFGKMANSSDKPEKKIAKFCDKPGKIGKPQQ